MNNALVASMEAIDFQRDSIFINEMALQYEACLHDPSKETLNKAAAALHKIAKKATGMHFNFHFAQMGEPNAFVICPRADIAVPMRPDEIATKIQRLGRPASEQELFKGTVDVAKGKVSGIYSDIPIDIFLAVELFTSRRLANITGRHVAAIAAHEIGHGFTYLRYLGNFVLSNVVVAEIARRKHEGADDKVIQEVVRVAEQKTGWRLRELGEINRSTDPLVVQQIVMAGMVESIRSELGTKFYDQRAFEFSADQFVARHGGAADIVQALDLLNRAYPDYNKFYRSNTKNIFLSLQAYLGMLISRLWHGSLSASVVLAVAGTTAAVPFAIGVGIAVASFSLLMALFSAAEDSIYDPVPQRFAAMRRELIASSKDQNLSPAQRKEIIEGIASIDEIIGNLTSGIFSHPRLLGDMMIGIFNGRGAEKKFQRQLEELVNNRLFELSNKLQTQTV